MPDLAGLRVALIAGTLGPGGAERQLFYMLRALRQSGAEPRVLCLTRGELWEERIVALGVPVTWVGQPGSRLARLRRIVAELRANRSDVLQSQHFYANLYAAGAARLLGLREIGALRNDGVSEVRANGAVLGRLSLRAPRVVAANSRAGIRNAIALGVPPARLHFLPNVVDGERFAVAHRATGSEVRVLTVGRLVAQKRLDRFLELLARLRRESPVPLRGIIAGDGPARGSLQRRAVELALADGAVEFRGIVADMRALYQEADIFVLTSDWEGTPNVVLEAMAAGLPVVSTRVGGVPDIVEHARTGYLLEAGDEDAATDAVLRLARDPALRQEIGERAREYVETHHAMHRLPAHLQALYTAALQ